MIPITNTNITDQSVDYEEDDEEEYWNRIYESLVDKWCSETNKPPSAHPYVRYYCGYVEPLCKKLDLPEYKLLAGFFMQEPLDLSVEDIDYTELHGIDWFDRSLVPWYRSFDRLMCDGETKPLTLQNMKDYDLDLWSYAIVRNLLCYDIICDADKDYIDECIDTYPHGLLLRFYALHTNRYTYMYVRSKFDEAIKANYLCVPDSAFGRLFVQCLRSIKP